MKDTQLNDALEDLYGSNNHRIIFDQDPKDSVTIDGFDCFLCKKPLLISKYAPIKSNLSDRYLWRRAMHKECFDAWQVCPDLKLLEGDK